MYNTKIINPERYRAALYIRLSREDEGEGESGSVKNQRSILGSFAKSCGIPVYSEYVDDGFSGTDFKRPAFRRMIEDILGKKVNMVITKDLSRLGRDYIMTGYYMEKFFPDNNVRFISVNDGIDTGLESGMSDITPFRAVINDMYAKDISKKIKSVKHYKQKKGLFIGGKAYYGYRLSETEKNKITVDPEAAAVVKKIFVMAAEGKSCREIARILNEKKVLPPAVYASVKAGKKEIPHGQWSGERISDMLKNEIYIGNMVQGKSKKTSYKSKKTVKIPREEWIVVQNTHEPIVDKGVFDTVQKILLSRRKTRQRKYNYPLKGMIFCHECGHPLAVINRPGKSEGDRLYFICRTYQRDTKQRRCTGHSVKEEAVNNAVAEKIREIFKNSVTEEELYSICHREYHSYRKREDVLCDVKKIENRISSIDSSVDRIYLDKLSGFLSEEDFLRLYRHLKEEKALLSDKLDYFKANEENSLREKNRIIKKLVATFSDIKTFNRELFLSLVERVEINEKKEIIIHFKCREV